MLLTKDKLYSYNSFEKFRNSTNESLNNIRNHLSGQDDFDIFLSHSYDDRDYILNLFSLLKTYNFKVYVDWIVDKTLNRGNVNITTAEIIRSRMKQSKCLIYATSDNSTNSKWMPWELGYFDGYKGKVAILPIVSDNQYEYQGQEYLSLYPYIDKASSTKSKDEELWVNEDNTSVLLKKWINS